MIINIHISKILKFEKIKMLNKTSLQDQVFSFGKNNIFGIEGKAKDFTNDSDEKFNNKMKESEQLRGRALKKQAENTGSPDIPGNGSNF